MSEQINNCQNVDKKGKCVTHSRPQILRYLWSRAWGHFKTSSTGDDPAEEMREERMRKPSNVTAREISVECASFALPLRCCVMTIKVFTINIIGDCW